MRRWSSQKVTPVTVLVCLVVETVRLPYRAVLLPVLMTEYVSTKGLHTGK